MNHPIEPFQVEVRHEPQRTVIFPRGEIDLATVGGLREHLEAQPSSGSRMLVIDLRHVGFMDVVGAHLLSDTRQRCGADRVLIVNPSGGVRRLLEFAGIGVG